MCVSPWFNTKVNSLIPCGGCFACRADNVSLWSTRFQSELKKYRSTFLTLTYDTLHLPTVPYGDNAKIATLRRDDMQKFLDNLRHQVKSSPLSYPRQTSNFKYLAVGEYGGLFQRPHYHLLISGLDFKQFEKFYDKLWRFGSVKSLPVENGSVRYVLDYLSNRLNGDLAKKLYDDNGIERPSMSCSKGIGLDFFVAHQEEINETGCVKIAQNYIPVPTYFRKMFSLHDSESESKRYDFFIKTLNDLKQKALSKGFKSLEEYQSTLKKTKSMSFVSNAQNHGLDFSLDFKRVMSDYYSDVSSNELNKSVKEALK